jgi:tetratricopeptide (TPR) repeat protein
MRPRFLKDLRLVQREDREWEFEFPRITTYDEEVFDGGIEVMDRNTRLAEQIFRASIKKYPEFIDARHHLALLKYRSKDPMGVLEAKRIWEELADIFWLMVPAEFQVGRDLLPWDHLDNRPYLRAVHSLACWHMDYKECRQAQPILEEMLLLNPDDNQGCRALSVEVYFARHRPAAVVELTNRYRDDLLPELLWGRVLACHQTGDQARAAAALRQAVANMPKVLGFILEWKKPRGQTLKNARYTMGSETEASEYWRRSYEYWVAVPSVREFIAERARAERLVDLVRS